jgi:hypothetical protein
VDRIDALVGRTSSASGPLHAFDLSDHLMLRHTGWQDYALPINCYSVGESTSLVVTANKVRPNGRQVISENAPLLLHESLHLKHHHLTKKGCAHRWPSSLRSSLVFSEPFDIVTSA